MPRLIIAVDNEDKSNAGLGQDSVRIQLEQNVVTLCNEAALPTFHDEIPVSGDTLWKGFKQHTIFSYLWSRYVDGCFSLKSAQHKGINKQTLQKIIIGEDEQLVIVQLCFDNLNNKQSGDVLLSDVYLSHERVLQSKLRGDQCPGGNGDVRATTSGTTCAQQSDGHYWAMDENSMELDDDVKLSIQAYNRSKLVLAEIQKNEQLSEVVASGEEVTTSAKTTKRRSKKRESGDASSSPEKSRDKTATGETKSKVGRTSGKGKSGTAAKERLQDTMGKGNKKAKKTPPILKGQKSLLSYFSKKAA